MLWGNGPLARQQDYSCNGVQCNPGQTAGAMAIWVRPETEAATVRTVSAYSVLSAYPIVPWYFKLQGFDAALSRGPYR